MKTPRFFYWLLFITTLLSIHACKKGCTDERARNYDGKAKTEDGSCLYCDSTVTLRYATSTNERDNDSQSPYFPSSVLRIDLDVKARVYTGNQCALLGLTGENICQPSYYYLAVQNLVNRPITYNGEIEIYNYSDNTRAFYNITSLRLEPYELKKLEMMNAPCVVNSIGNAYGLSAGNGWFVYH